MNKITMKSVVQRTTKVLTSIISGETVMMDVQNGVYFGLDGVGTEVWSRLEQPKTVSLLVSELQEIFEGEEEAIINDVLELLNNMVSKGLLLDLS